MITEAAVQQHLLHLYDRGPSARALHTCPPTYMQRGGTLVCTTCHALIGATEADQILHTTWPTTLAELFALANGR